MAQAVWVGNEPAEDARVEPAATHGEEEGGGRDPHQGRPAVAEPETDPPRRLFPERHKPLLAALAAHVDALAVEVDVAEVERHHLG